MLRLLAAALAAACFQFVAVTLATAAVLLFAEIPARLDLWLDAGKLAEFHFIAAQMDIPANSRWSGFDEQPVC